MMPQKVVLLLVLLAPWAYGQLREQRFRLPIEGEKARTACEMLLAAASKTEEPPVSIAGNDLYRFVQAYFGEGGVLTVQAVHFAVLAVGSQYGAFDPQVLLRQPQEAAHEISNAITQYFNFDGISVSQKNVSGWKISKHRKKQIEKSGGNVEEQRKQLSKMSKKYKMSGQALEEGAKLAALLAGSPLFREGFEKLVAGVMPLLTLAPTKLVRGESLLDILARASASPSQSDFPVSRIVFAGVGAAVGFVTELILDFLFTHHVDVGELVLTMGAGSLVWTVLGGALYDKWKSWKAEAPRLLPAEGLGPTSLAITPSLIPFKPALANETLSAENAEGVLEKGLAQIEALSRAYHQASVMLSAIREHTFVEIPETFGNTLAEILQALENNEPETEIKRSRVQAALVSLRPQLDIEVGETQQYIVGLKDDLKSIHTISTAWQVVLDQLLQRLSSSSPAPHDAEAFLHTMAKLKEAQDMLGSILENISTSKAALAEAGEIVSKRRSLFDVLQHLLDSKLTSEEGLGEHEIEAFKEVRKVFFPVRS